MELNEEDYFVVAVMGKPIEGSTSTYAALKMTRMVFLNSLLFVVLFCFEFCSFVFLDRCVFNFEN